MPRLLEHTVYLFERNAPPPWERQKTEDYFEKLQFSGGLSSPELAAINLREMMVCARERVIVFERVIGCVRSRYCV